MIKKYFSSLLVIMSLGLLTSSCVVVSTKHDNGNHKGWTKNTNNPHHPATTNPGHTKNGKSNGNGNSNGKKHKK